MHRPFWDTQLETLPPERRHLLREHRLHWQVRRCWDGSPFYRARLEAAGLDPANVRGATDWARLPMLREIDLPASADWAVAPQAWWHHLDEIPGRPPRVVTDGDAIQQADLAARALWAAGARPAGELPLPGAGLDPLTRASLLAGAGRIRAAIGGRADPFVPAVVLPFVAPTLAYACREGGNIHWNDDHFWIEIVQPESGAPVELGSLGLVIVSDLAREGSPLLRFGTGLRTSVHDDLCPCGRTSIWSRSGDVLG